MKITASGAVRRHIDPRRIVLVILGCLLTSTQVLAADYTYVRISFPGSVETWATGINARGDIVGHYFTADGGTYGFLLRKGVYTTIEHPDAAGLPARRINSRGDIVGVVHDFTGATHGYLLSGGQLTRFDSPDLNASFTAANGLNDAGDRCAASPRAILEGTPLRWRRSVAGRRCERSSDHDQPNRTNQESTHET